MSKCVKTNEQLYSEKMNLFNSLMASIWSHCKIFHCYYKHCYQIFFMYCIDFLLRLLLWKLFAVCILFIWLNQLIYNVSFIDCYMNVSWWNVVNYNLTYTSNSLDSPCFAESKLVESSERNMLLLLLFCILQSSFYETWVYVEALWKYAKTCLLIPWLLQITSREQHNTSAGDDDPLIHTDEVGKWRPPPPETDIIDVYRSIDNKRAQKQMSKGLSECNFKDDNHKGSTKKPKTDGLTLETEPHSLSHQDTDTQPVEQSQYSKVSGKQSVKKTSMDIDDYTQLSLQKACIIYGNKLYTKLSYLTSLPCIPKLLIGVTKSCYSRYVCSVLHHNTYIVSARVHNRYLGINSILCTPGSSYVFVCIYIQQHLYDRVE